MAHRAVSDGQKRLEVVSALIEPIAVLVGRDLDDLFEPRDVARGCDLGQFLLAVR